MEQAHVNHPVEKRQFGRRQSNIRGSALVANDQPKLFTIRDLSEGGALLVFDDPQFVPERSVRIQIDGTKMVLLGEVRHQSKTGVGVRFLRPSEGAELNRYFLTKPIDIAAVPGTELPRRPHAPSPVVRGQDLRASLHLVHPAAEIAIEAADADNHAAERSALAAGLMRVRNVFALSRNDAPLNAAATSKDAGDADLRR